MYPFIMRTLCALLLAEVQDQYPLSLNPVQKADNPIQDRNKSIGPLSWHF